MSLTGIKMSPLCHLTRNVPEMSRECPSNVIKCPLRTPPTKIAKNGYFGTKIVADPRDIFKKIFCPEIAETLFCNRSL